ncbi:hypothetical protein BS78_09G108300 [Paspalum vaginatum]|nr:hypothetical protein BS78_09G108300 [Paspalum vaginatum]
MGADRVRNYSACIYGAGNAAGGGVAMKDCAEMASATLTDRSTCLDSLAQARGGGGCGSRTTGTPSGGAWWPWCRPPATRSRSSTGSTRRRTESPPHKLHRNPTLRGLRGSHGLFPTACQRGSGGLFPKVRRLLHRCTSGRGVACRHLQPSSPSPAPPRSPHHTAARRLPPPEPITDTTAPLALFLRCGQIQRARTGRASRREAGEVRVGEGVSRIPTRDHRERDMRTEECRDYVLDSWT